MAPQLDGLLASSDASPDICNGKLGVGTSGLNISVIKYLLKLTAENFTQVIVSTALNLGGVGLVTAEFGSQRAPGLKLFTCFGAWMVLVCGVIAGRVLAPALRPRIKREGVGRS